MLFHRHMGRAAQTVKPSVKPPAAAAHMLDEEVHDAVPLAHGKAAQTVEPSVKPHAPAAHMLDEEVHDAVPQAPELQVAVAGEEEERLGAAPRQPPRPARRPPETSGTKDRAEPGPPCRWPPGSLARLPSKPGS